MLVDRIVVKFGLVRFARVNLRMAFGGRQSGNAVAVNPGMSMAHN
jgi:hypothetical protein